MFVGWIYCACFQNINIREDFLQIMIYIHSNTLISFPVFPRVFLSGHFKWLSILSILPCWTHLLYLLHSRCIYAWTDHLTSVKYKIKKTKARQGLWSISFYTVQKNICSICFPVFRVFFVPPVLANSQTCNQSNTKSPGSSQKKNKAPIYINIEITSFFFKFNAFQGLLLLDIIHLCEEPYLCFPISHQVVNAIVKGNCILHAL